MMVVMKFGGTSLGDSKKIQNVCSLIKARAKENPIVVVSAIGDITDTLITIAEKAANGQDVSKALAELDKQHQIILKELSLPTNVVDNVLHAFHEVIDKIFVMESMNAELWDEVQSFGERLSCRIVAAALKKINIEAKAYDAFDIGMITTPHYGSAEPLPDTQENIANNLQNLKHIPIITGFIGKDSTGTITTLGRGGSDYSAAIIGAAINAKAIEIWTDVNGVMTADPKIANKASTIDTLSFNEASELSYFGAKVLHPKAILPAIDNNIPVKVLNTFQPKHKGTTIIKKSKAGKEVKAIACKKGNVLINVSSTRMLAAHGFLARLFSIFEEHKKSVDMIATSEVSVSLTVDNDKGLDNIEKELSNIAETEIQKNKGIVCVVGDAIKETPGIVGKVFSVLGKENINIEMISQGASEINISFVINDKDVEKAVKSLHKEFLE